LWRKHFLQPPQECLQAPQYLAPMWIEQVHWQRWWARVSHHFDKLADPKVVWRPFS